MAITLRVSLSDSPESVGRKVLAAVRDELDSAFRRAAPAITRRVQDVCTDLIKGTDEYRSLLSGELLAELGIPDVEARLRQVLLAVRRGVGVRVQPTRVAGDRVVGGLSVDMVRSDFEDVLGLPAARYVSNGRYVIPWLQWLLVEGDRVVVTTHEVTYALTPTQRLRSRTRMALMRPGSGWRVPPEYSGTLSSNFISRAFDAPGVENSFAKVLREEIQRRLDR
jgi:hypothetical protein